VTGGRKAAAILADTGQFVDASIPREAMKTKATKPGAFAVASSRLKVLARTITFCGWDYKRLTV
jgi:hypothetical protein